QLKPNQHEAHFGDTQDFQQFSEALQKTLQARPVFPVPSSVGLVSYKFNEETGTYEKVQGSLGPLLAERATTSGRGHVNLSFSHTFSDFESFNGSDTIPLTLRHCLTSACTFGRPVDDPALTYLKDVIAVDVRLKLKSSVLATAVTYGLTDRVDVGVVVPYIRNDLNVLTNARVIVDPTSNAAIHVFDPAIETPGQFGTAHALGIGDVILRGKFQVPAKLPFQTGVMADVTLPSGDKENFLGTGDLRVKGTFIVSKTSTRFSPHVNIGYELNTTNTDLSSVEYRAGSEIVARPRVTLLFDLLGTIQPSGDDEFRVRALGDESLIPRSVIDGALGAKWQFTDRATLNFNFLMPLNDSGIRPNSVVTFGVQFGM
ncbi:MAG TPA: transporter, partial [Thermoanaerobaculia bacterium]|nr:transporter [Thermoanaerobaculia bacterium]